MPFTDLACAITLEKLSLRILIRDVIRRILVMQTKMSFYNQQSLMIVVNCANLP